MNDPSNVLQKVRRSLGRSCPPATVPAPPSLDEPLVRLVYTDIGLPELFAKRAEENKIHVTTLRVDDLAEELTAFLKSQNVQSIALPNSAFLDRVGVAQSLREAGFSVRLWSDMRPDDLYDTDAGVTDVWRVVAETGSLVVKASPEHGRALSLVPPLHVAIVEPKNCVADLIDLFELAKAETDAAGMSAFTIITGPSKTSDIEMNLVVGVHGPGQVQVFLLT